MSRRALAVVANFHRERRVGAKTARFLGAAQAHLSARGIDLNVEFVLDRADEDTDRRIAAAAAGIPGARLHRLDSGNLGLARAHGVRHARGDIVCFADGDDFFSMNWFETALEALSGARRREIVHTQFLVGFGDEQFIRETMDSRHPSFDPLSLAVDWYWNGNLAMQTWLFEEVPIEPYDHDAGLGSEDWHWSCNGLADGIARVVAPDTCYYYRIKPPKLALGRVADVVHKRSRLYDASALPPPPAEPREGPLPVSALSPRFFAQAREIERFDLGVSFLRAVEAGALTVRHFKPHTPPVVGRVLRGALASGFGEDSTVVFADLDRLPGGLASAKRLAEALTGADAPATNAAGRLYVLEGEEGRSEACADGYVIAVAELRASGLNLPQRQRLIARFIIQASRLTVVNLLSARRRSLALSYARATRGSVRRWVNLVTEYGLDALSQTWEELDSFDEAGLSSEAVALFEKTAREAADVRGRPLLHDPALEAAWVSGRIGDRAGASMACVAPTPEPLEPTDRERGIRLALATRDGRLSASEVADLSDAARAADACLLVLGAAQVGADMADLALLRQDVGARAGLRIPAVTVIGQGDQPNFNLRHPVERLNARLAAGDWPAELLLAGVIVIRSADVERALANAIPCIDLRGLLRTAVAGALERGADPVGLLSPSSISFIDGKDLAALDVPGLARAFDGGWWDLADG